ncbi:hypothetical protein NC652_007243 [Populus alba x Populus x berolinensis]|nr:hypothetical protein NC652_007243 [Populus alba x Populus x berolinensis]
MRCLLDGEDGKKDASQLIFPINGVAVSSTAGALSTTTPYLKRANCIFSLVVHKSSISILSPHSGKSSTPATQRHFSSAGIHHASTVISSPASAYAPATGHLFPA